MTFAAIICEYNPFHLGHLYHLNETKKTTGADGIICIMSGNYVQRGQPAICNKFARAGMALAAGADIVIELPTMYALGNAKVFSLGAVSIADMLGVDYLVFGSESGDIDILSKTAQLLSNEPPLLQKLIKKHIQAGNSYPTALSRALCEYDKSFENVLSNSNDILGIEYLKALIALKSNITPITVQRQGTEYNSISLNEKLVSASAIRNDILQGGTQYKNAIPTFTDKILSQEIKKGCCPISISDFEAMIMYQLRRMSVSQLASLPEATEGIENIIYSESRLSPTVETVLTQIKSKRYTGSKLSRTLFHALLGMDKRLYSIGLGCLYARVLGFRKQSAQVLSQLISNSRIPVVTRVSDFMKDENTSPGSQKIMELDILATNIYSLVASNPEYRQGQTDYTNKLIVIE